MLLIVFPFLTFMGSLLFPINSEVECNLQATYSIETSNDVKITVNATGGKQPYYYFFLDERNNPITWEFDKHVLTTSSNRTPRIVRILDADGCSFTVTIK